MDGRLAIGSPLTTLAVVEESYLICMVVAIPLNLIIPYGTDDFEEGSDAAVLPTMGSSQTQAESQDEVEK